MSYHQLTAEERVIVATLHGQGLSGPKIAKQIGRLRSTLYRELKRNATPHDGFYRARRAHERTVARRRRSRRNQHFDARQMGRVDTLLRGQWSPEQVSGHLRRSGEMRISHETIYRHAWRDRQAGGSLHEHLRGARKRRRKRYGAYDSRERLAGKRMIAERPGSVESRQWLGHWEIDTVLGTTSECVVTLVERATGYTLIGKMAARTVAELNRATLELMRRHPGRFLSITADNGTEFHGYKDLEMLGGVIVYFATPHHSWERGTNENTNGLIRQYLPKATSMKDLRQKQCDAIAEKLNNRPRERYDYKTPNQRFHAI